MKTAKRILSIVLCLALCLSLLPVNALALEPAAAPLRAAQTASIDFSTQNYENGQAIESVELDDNVSIVFYKGSNNNAPRYYSTGTAVRCYGGNYFTVTAASGYTITEVSLSFGSGDGSNAITTNTGDYEDGTWTGGTDELTFTIGGSSGHRRIKTISVTYTDGGSSGPALSGSGTAEDPYLLSNLDELLLFAAMVNGTGDYEGNAQPGLCAKLTADVDASSLSQWTPIGNTEVGYSGSFDGQGHSVTLTMQDSTETNQGLFGTVSGGTVENLRVAGSIDTDSEDVGSVGGVAGCLNGGTIQNCSGSVAIQVTCNAGGVVGIIGSGSVTNCYNTGTISGDDAGGVVGYMEDGTVTSCYNTGAVTESGNAGGIASFMSGGSVTGCYNTGTVSGVYSGGIAGFLIGGSVTGCYNVGAIDGATSGGVIGDNVGGTVTNCYYDKTLCNTVTGAINGADTGNVKGLTTTQMTGAAALTNMGGFGADVWVLTGAYPKLKPYTAPTLAALTTDAEGNYLIGSADDWNTLAEIVFGGAELSGASFRQTADFTVGVMLGCADHPFTGSYDGDGHTLTLALEDAAQDFVAPFNSVNAAKLRHLCVTGNVFGKMHCAGLVGSVRGGKTVVDDCLIDVAVASSGSGTHCGGVIGHAGTFETVVTGCVFTGSIGAGKTAATFWGWSDDGAEGGLANCLDLSDSDYPIGLGSGDLVTVNTYYTASDKQAGSGRPWAEAKRGKLAYAVTPGTAVSLGFHPSYTIDLSAPVTGLTGGAPGLLRGNTIYAAAGETLQLALGYTGAEPLNGFEASAGTLTETDGGYTLLMPAQEVSITALVPTSVSSWTELEEALLAGGTILLTADVSPDNPYFADALVVPTGVSATLDLNGHIVDRGMTEVNSWHGGVIEINGGSLTVIDSDPTAAHESAVSYEDPLTGESVTVLGGVITGGWPDQYGGGVCVKGGSFTLTSGSIVGNHVGKTGFGAVEALGGGVYLQSGSFTMSGGVICGNQAVNRNTMMPNLLGRGGGVYVNGGSFTMSNGVICGNAAGNRGGGVYLATPNSGSDGNMNVSGGVTVTGNAVQGAANNVYLEEGGKLTVTDALTGSIGVTMQSPGVFTDGLPGHGTAANFSSDDPGYILSLTDGGEAQLAEEFYPLWIAGVQFSSANRTVDATDNAAISSGTAVYDRESNTLTLTDFVYSGVGSTYRFDCAALLYDGTDDLTVALSGENRLEQTEAGSNYSDGAVLNPSQKNTQFTVTFQSTDGGSLYLSGGTSSDKSYGLYSCRGNLVFSGAAVTAVGGTGIFSNGLATEGSSSVTVKSGAVTAVGGATTDYDSYGILCTDAIAVEGGTLTALGGNAKRNSYGVYCLYEDMTDVTVTGGRFVAQGATKALARVAALSADGLSVLAGEDAASAVPVTGDGWKDKKYVTVLPPVSYLDPTDADEPEKSCAVYTVLNDQTTLTEGWYVVAPGTLTIDERVTVTGEVNLILCDGATLTAPQGVSVNEGNSLTIWAQSDATLENSSAGALIANSNDYSGIGGTDGDCGTVTINGGAVTATAEEGAGIGSGFWGNGGTVTVNGGAVTATSFVGAGIGGAQFGKGGFITITGGTVTASSDSGAAIGGGSMRSGGVITISGGTVTATGRDGAGIGGGLHGSGGTVTITGGTVTATVTESISSNAQAIGRGTSYGYVGDPLTEGSLEIPGMKVYDNETATTPVPAGERESKCRDSWVKLELCEPHVDENDDHECDHCGTAWLYMAEIDPLTYSGSVLTPELHVFFGTTELQAGTDYDVAYAQGSETVSPIKAGSYTVTVTGKGSCEKAGSVSGIFTVNPLALTVTANSDTKVYDGTPLTNDGYTHTTLGTGDSFASLTVTGSQTLVGFSSNVPSAAQLVNANGENVNACYAITYANGTLTVTQSEKALVISSATQSWVYDGQSHSANVYTLFYEGTEVNADSTGTVFPLPTGDTVTITPTASPVTNYDTSYDSNNTYTYVLENAVCYANVQASFGTISITKRPASVTAHPQTVEQGRPIATGTEHAVLTGAVEGHVLSAVTLTDSGTDTITDDGVITPSAATVSDAQGADVTANYELSYADGVLTVTDHAWGDWETTVAPTCTESGEEKRSCANCDAFQTRPVDPLGHDLVHHDAQAPTCTAIGWEAYDTCSRCAYTTYAELPALGHDLIHHDAQEPTCTEIGWEDYDSCSRCSYTTYAELPALGHDLIHHDAQEPTCTEIGWEAYDTCSRCSYTTYAELPALGHELVHHDALAPTCTEIGWDAYDTCARCDYTTYVELEPIGHEWGEPGYEWSNDLSSVTATAVCAHDPSHILSETVQTDFIITKPSTFESTGSGYYLAVFENERFETQTQTVVIPEVSCAGGDECPSQHFTDMPPITSYAHIPIDWAVVNHITAGTTPTTFSPEATCTRAQFVTFLWRVAGSPEPTSDDNPFSDVNEDAYYYKPVLWAVEKGITAGTGAGAFSPDLDCTRAQVVTFLWRYAESPEPTLEENPFEDVTEDAYYYTPVLWAVENGITAGTSDTTFSPDDDCTRAQVMTFLYRKFGQG